MNILTTGTAVGSFKGREYSVGLIGGCFGITDDVGYEAYKNGSNTMSYVNAAKNPYHKDAIGYKTNGCPKDHKEYLYAIRGNRFIMNWVDGDDPKYISDIMIDSALTFIDNAVELGHNVLVNCNQGLSRSPSLVLLWLVKNGKLEGTYESIIRDFKQLYPRYRPGIGCEQYCKHRINSMVNGLR